MIAAVAMASTLPDIAEVIVLGVGLLVLGGIAICDARWRIVPAVLIWPALLGGVLWRALRGDWGYLAAAAVLGSALVIVTLVAGRARAGLGDAQVYALAGLLLGWLVVLAPVLVAGEAFFFYRVVLRQKPTAVPVTPFLWVSTVLLLVLKAVLPA